MLKKIIYFLKRIFKFNSIKYLPAPSLAGINGNYEIKNNFNLVTLENNSNNLQLEQINVKPEKEDQNLTNENLLSYVFETEKDEENFKDENQFQYDENKVKEMNKKIDYYKKDPDKLYLLTLNEILEINFYYEKRIEKLENINN